MGPFAMLGRTLGGRTAVVERYRLHHFSEIGVLGGRDRLQGANGVPVGTRIDRMLHQDFLVHRKMDLG